MTESEPSCPECLEQARIIGKGAERELAYQARIAELEAEIALADRLAGYATHTRSCGIGDGQFALCTCGLPEALAALREQEKNDGR